MQEEKKTKAYFVNTETNEHFYMGEGSLEVTQDGEKWTAKAKMEVTRTQAVLNLLHFVVINGGEKEKQEAARVLDTLYSNLDSLEIVERDDKKGVTYHWNVKAGIREANADKAVKEVLVLPIMQGAVKHVFQVSQTPGPGDVKRDGGPLRISPYMAQTRIPEKEGGGTKTTYKKPQIELSPAESKFERAFLRLLRDNSILDRKHPAYLLGNDLKETESGPEAWTREVEVWDNGRGIEVAHLPYARLNISWADLYKAYADKPAAEISGRERKTIRGLLDGMKAKLGETVWQREVKRDGQKFVQRLRFESPLIMQAGLSELTPEEAAAVDAGGEVPEEKERLLLLLHPAYTHDIAEKSHTLPADYDRRLSKAIGKGGKMKAAHERLLMLLNQIRCGGATETKIDLDNLIHKMGLERIKTKQGLPQAKKEIAAGLDIAQKIGLIYRPTNTPGAKGQEQYQIKFNPDFIKA